jgi:hypothetical protein
MEIIKVKSAHSLLTSIVSNRPLAEQTHTLNCRQYLYAFQNWRKSQRISSQACGVMTLESARIWLTEQEGERVAQAIQAHTQEILFD